MPTTVEQCWKHYNQHHLTNTCSGKTAQRFWRCAVSDFANMDPDALMPSDFKRWGEMKMKKGLSQSTVRRYLGVICACLNHAEKHELIKRAPYVPIPAEPPTKVRSLTRQQCVLLLDAADKSGNWRKSVFVRLALGTGQRPGAICELTWNQVNMQDGIIDFRATDPLANRRKRRAVVPINEMVSVALSIARKNAKGDYVIHRWGRRLSHPKDMMMELAKATGIKKLSAHVLRHTVASLLLQDHKNLFQVSKLLGHADSKITEKVYFQHPPEWLKELTDELKF